MSFLGNLSSWFLYMFRICYHIHRSAILIIPGLVKPIIDSASVNIFFIIARRHECNTHGVSYLKMNTLNSETIPVHN